MSIRVNSPDNGSDGGAEDGLSQFFAAYRDACPSVEPSANFLPGIWQKIEGRRSFWFSFEHLARTCAAVAVAVCLLLAVLNIEASRKAVPMPGGYADALAAASSAEHTYYAEGIRTASSPGAGEPAVR